MFDIIKTSARRRTTGAWLAAALAIAAAACQAKTPSNSSNASASKAVAAAFADGMCSPGLAIAPESPVAKIGDQTVSCADLYAKNKAQIQRAKGEFDEKVHQIHEGTLEQLIDERLLEAKAKAAGKTTEEYIAAEAKVEAPTEEEMKELYDSAGARGQQLPPYEEVKGDIAQFLTQQKTQQTRADLVKKLREEAGVQVMLPPLLPAKVEVEALGPSKGPESARITIVEFSDFECPFCGRVEPTLEKVFAEYGDKVRLVYRDYPLPMHSNAPKASEAALCANDQGKYWEMHAKLFANQQALQADKLPGYAQELALDMDKFSKCLESGEKAAVVAASAKAGEAAGVSGTPAFFINGRMISGAQPFERFKEIIDHELKQAAN